MQVFYIKFSYLLIFQFHYILNISEEVDTYLKLVYKNSEEDYINFINYIIIKNKRYIQLLSLIPLLSIVVGFLVFFNHITNSNSSVFIEFSIFLLINFLFLIFTLNYYRILMRQLKKEIRKNINFVYSEKSIEIFNNNLIYKYNKKEIIISLCCIKDILENDNNVYIIQKRGKNYINTPIIPIDVFENKFTKQDFINKLYKGE